MVKFGLTILLFFSLFKLKAQHAILEQFSASQIQSHVLVEWVISVGNTCNGIYIYRAGVDSIFEIIGDIQGVCGDSEQAISYVFKDSTPLPNQLNIYKLSLGNQGYSEPISVQFLANGTKNFSVYYGESFEAKLFVNDRMLGTRIWIYNLKGKAIDSIYIRQREFTIPKENLQSGMYVLVYIKTDAIQTQRFIIQ